MAATKTFLLALVVFAAVVAQCRGEDAAEKDDDSWTGWALNKLSEGVSMVDSENAKHVATNVVEKTGEAASGGDWEKAFGDALEKAKGSMSPEDKKKIEDAKEKAKSSLSPEDKRRIEDARQGKGGSISADDKRRFEQAKEKAKGSVSAEDKHKIEQAKEKAKGSMTAEDKRKFEEAKKKAASAGATN